MKTYTKVVVHNEETITINSTSLGRVTCQVGEFTNTMLTYTPEIGTVCLNNVTYTLSQKEANRIMTAFTKAVSRKMSTEKHPSSRIEELITDVLSCADEPVTTLHLWNTLEPIVVAENILKGATPINTFRTLLYRMVASGALKSNTDSGRNRKFSLA